jgi:hypothetical protein
MINKELQIQTFILNSQHKICLLEVLQELIGTFNQAFEITSFESLARL